MATAVMIGDMSATNTQTVVPLSCEVVQGSTQVYQRTAESWQSPVPVFYAPYADQGESAAYWDLLFRSSQRTRYAVIVRSERNAFPWDRLVLDLMRISTLPDNWDGEGAEAVPANALSAASMLLSLARAAAESPSRLECPAPGLYPSIEGGVVLKWVSGDRELKCTVMGETVEVVRWRSADAYASDGLWDVPVQGVWEHFEWLLQ